MDIHLRSIGAFNCSTSSQHTNEKGQRYAFFFSGDISRFSIFFSERRLSVDLSVGAGSVRGALPVKEGP